MTQRWYYEKAFRQSAECNETFLHLVETGLTAKELRALIAKRPGLWSRYSAWLDKLPSGE
jgi:hypothetical protein